MDDKIATIHGGRKPDEESKVIVETLERLLAEAKTGEIVGLAYAVVKGSGVNNTRIVTGWDGEGVESLRYKLGSAITFLQHRYYQAFLDEPN